MDIDFSKELTIAKKAALEAGNFLKKIKIILTKQYLQQIEILNCRLI